MLLTGFFGEEKAGAFDDQVGADVAPFQVSRITLGSEANSLAVDHQIVALDRNITVEVAMHGIVLEHVGQIICFQQIVDTDYFDIAEVLGDGTEGHTTDTAKTVNTDFNRHVVFLLKSD